MKSTTVRRLASPVLALGLSLSHGLMAQDQHSHPAATPKATVPLDQQQGLIKAVRDATAKYQDVKAAMADGYQLVFGCVSGEDSGAMGLHYLNSSILNAGILDPSRPTIVIYEPQPDGTQKLIGADFLVMADAWNLTHSGPPQLMGQWFHLFTSPNRFGLPPFYTLHVWAWKENPTGAFVNWHSDVSCAAYDPKQ